MTAKPDLNALGQPVGPALSDWKAPPLPPHETKAGRYCRLEPLAPARHAADLHAAYALDRDGRNWTYLSMGPFASAAAYREWADRAAAGTDPQFYAIVDPATGKALGVAAFMRMDPAHGIIEVGNLNFSPLLQHRTAATEAMYLMMKRAFELGYRRYEWKCNSLNYPSRTAAQRLGFSYEGLFRQGMVTRGRSRDSMWFSIIDGEWPALRAAFERWLAPENFDERGTQRVSLSSLTAPLLKARPPGGDG